MDVLLLHNENAGESNPPRDELIALLRDAGYRAIYRDLHMALGTPDVFNLGEFVVVAGGDGSIRKAALHFLGHPRALAPLPLGTANNIARSLGIDGPLEKIIAGWSPDRRRKLDVGYVDGPWGRRPFIEGIGLGLLARTIAIAQALPAAEESESRAEKLGHNQRVLAALAHEIAAVPLELRIDGLDASGAFFLLEILNINRAGPGIELAPAADPFDGRFDVVTVAGDERAKLQDFFKAPLSAAAIPPALTVTRCRGLQLVARDCELRLDDEIIPLAGETHLGVSLAPGALELVLPV